MGYLGRRTCKLLGEGAEGFRLWVGLGLGLGPEFEFRGDVAMRG